MTDQNGRAAAEIGAEALDEVDGAVVASRASDGDRQRAPIVLPVGGQPGLDEAPHVLEHGADFRLLLEKFDHGAIQAAQGTKPRIVVGIGEAAHVENEIRIQGNALLVAERFEQEHHRFGSNVEQVLDPVAQGIRQQVGGVEALTDLAYRGEELALAREAFFESARACCERVAPASLGEALDQGIVLGVEKKEAQVHALILERGDVPGNLLEGISGAGVDAHRDPLVTGTAQQLRRFLEQRARKIVDAVVAAVLERVEGDALAGTRLAADQHELHFDTLAERRRPRKTRLPPDRSSDINRSS